MTFNGISAKYKNYEKSIITGKTVFGSSALKMCDDFLNGSIPWATVFKVCTIVTEISIR